MSMTNDELKALCERVIRDHHEASQVGILATECLRLLAQCDAMREMLYDVAEIAKFLNWRSDIGCDKAQEIIDSIHEGKWGGREGIWVQVSKALSQLGERT